MNTKGKLKIENLVKFKTEEKIPKKVENIIKFKTDKKNPKKVENVMNFKKEEPISNKIHTGADKGKVIDFAAMSDKLAKKEGKVSNLLNFDLEAVKLEEKAHE